MGKVNTGGLRGQVSLFRDFRGRYRRTMAALDTIRADDIVYATSDYWFDVLPPWSAARPGEADGVHMDAPRLRKLRAHPARRGRTARLVRSLLGEPAAFPATFCPCPRKHIFFLHPAMQSTLARSACARRR